MMSTDSWMGPSFPEQGWVPAPRYLMRRSRILSMTSGLKPGKILEIGPGAATLLMEFASRGFQCEALESSDEARELAAALIRNTNQSIELYPAPSIDWNKAFDTLFAFDVLEHIDDDEAALRQWRSWLKPDGALFLSVPARMALWTAGDEWAGHFRRYERESLIALLERTGFSVDVFECYGFPLTNITERASARIYRKTMRSGNTNNEAQARRLNNDRSGIDRRPVMRLYPLLKSPPGALAMRSALAFQSLFLHRDWGSGYLLRASLQRLS